MKMYMGFIEALLSAAFFGLIPFFFLPILELGFTTESSIAFRFLIASFIMVVLVVVKGQSFYFSFKALIIIILTAFVYFFAAQCLFFALTLTPSGIVTTIFFTNPIFVMLSMVVFYKEKLEAYKVVFCFSTLFGVALLSGFFSSMDEINMLGVFSSVLAGFAYAFYMLGLLNIQQYKFSKEVVSAYLFFFCALISFVYAGATDTLVFPKSLFEVALLTGSGLFTAVLANILLMSAITKIGSVLTAILGAMEPITAVLIGVMVFHEQITLHTVLGIMLVIVSVILLTTFPMLRHKKQMAPILEAVVNEQEII